MSAPVSAMPAQSKPHMSGGLIASIVVLVVLVVGVVVLAVMLSRRINTTKIKNYANCVLEQRHGVQVADLLGGPERSYWLGTLAGGAALYTNLPFGVSVGGEQMVKVTPYIITALGSINNTGYVNSPMIGAPFGTATPVPVTPPPQLAAFDWKLITAPMTTVPEFHKAAQSVDLTEGGVTVGGLSVISQKFGISGYMDLVFLCGYDADDKMMHPLCVLGGTLVTDTALIPAPGNPGGTNPVYNVGFMPLLYMLPAASLDVAPAASSDVAPAASSDVAPPGVAFLNVYPQIPTLTNFDTTTLDPTADTTFNVSPTHQKYGPPGATQSVAVLTCTFDPSVQQQGQGLPAPGILTNAVATGKTPPTGTAADNRPAYAAPTGPPSVVNNCHFLSVPAFDVKDPKVSNVANQATYVDAILPYTTGVPAKDPASLSSNYMVRVGQTSALGIIRTRQWSGWGTGAYETAVQLSNPTITASATNSPYVTVVVPIPRQYPTTTTTATTQIYAGATNFTPFTLPAYNDQLCSATNPKYVVDPAAQKATPGVIDEPILSLFARSTVYTDGGKLMSSLPIMVVGFGIKTGTLYLRCGRGNTKLPPADHLVSKSPSVCAYCSLPTLSAQTVCWPGLVGTTATGPSSAESAAGLINPEAVPFPILKASNFPDGGPTNATGVFPGTTFAPPRAQAPSPPGLDVPYVALGAAVGSVSSTHGGHAANVMPWIPLVNVPTGDEAQTGFGRYYGAIVSSIVNTGTFNDAGVPLDQIVGGSITGLCASLGVPAFQPGA
jgi:hypothetical protein